MGRRVYASFVTIWRRPKELYFRYHANMRMFATFALILAACTAHNPNYTGGGGGGGGSGDDLAGSAPADLAGAVLDLSGPLGACSAGQRQCSGTVASDRCEGGMFVVDRQCPAGSACTSSYCAPPPTMLGTQIGLRCDGQGGPQQAQCLAKAGASCQPFVDAATRNLRWFCDTNVGGGTATARCTRGSECRSGVCAVQAGICFDACQQNNDCTLDGTPGLTCQSMAITVEGVTVTAKGCHP